ncbi:MAG: VanZ family protein [Bacilli bacterium]|nr:VanZ family protein [bacterium]MDY2697893.1 VanZ family protein [Bacilli bacterium]
MDYVFSTKTSIMFFPIIACLFTIPYILKQYHKYGSINKLRTLIVYSFILYMMTIYFLVILPLPDISEVVNNKFEYNLIPFSFINDIIKETSFNIMIPSTYLKALTEHCIYVVIFNILMTVPFGMYLRYYYKASFKKVLFLSFFLSLFFELTQLTGLYFIYPKPYRLFDIDDLLLNTTGGVLGYFLFGLIEKYLPSRDKIDEDSKEKGQAISGLRRLTYFFLDLFIFTFFYSLVSIFINNELTQYICLIIYYILIPYLKNGYTLAGKFLNIKIVSENKLLFRICLRAIFIYIYYYKILYIMTLPTLLFMYFDLQVLANLYLPVAALFLVLFYIINVLHLLKHKTMFYDSLLKVNLESTIKSK